MTGETGGLHAELRGDPLARPSIVLLHGFGGSAKVWAAVAPALEDLAPLVIFDLPGHHRSMHAEGSGGAGRMAKAVLADLDRRGIAEVHLVGHSMGGAVAALMALRAPERIRSLTLLAPGGFGHEINHRLLERYAAATEPDAMRIALEQMFGWNAEIPEAYLDSLVKLRNAPGAVKALQSILPTMTTGEGPERRQGVIPHDDLARLEMPVKVLWGTQDRVLPTRQAHKLPPLFATHVFDNTGHMLIEEQEAAVVFLIRQNFKAAEM